MELPERMLVEEVKDAEDVAAGLQVFLEQVPPRATDISANMSELFAISSTLRAFHHSFSPMELGQPSVMVAQNIAMTLNSLAYTLKSVRDMFGRSKYTAYSGSPQYRALWDDLDSQLRAESNQSLCSRLENYRIFLQGLFDLWMGTPSAIDLRIFHSEISSLLRRQELADDYAHQGGAMARPPLTHFATYPSYAGRSSATSSSNDYEPYSGYPYSPEIPMNTPQSPTFSNVSSQTYSSWETYSSSSSGTPLHWVRKVFDGRHPLTPFRRAGQSTRCVGRDDPQIIDLLERDAFIRVHEMHFEECDVRVRFYWRPSDHRARIAYLSHDRNTGLATRFCLPFTALQIRRADSTLQLCRADQGDGRLILWANLKFTAYERMVLFYCAFVAMKHQDHRSSSSSFQDICEPPDNVQFAGEVMDDSFLHIFRVYRDRDSGAVRFETTPRRGKMKGTPIWTAFVTDKVGDRHWMKRIDSKTIQFRGLRPYVFCDNYVPPRTPSGHFQLKFTSKSDSEQFSHVMSGLARRR
ncbi:hypothetical protein BDY21DRAFT_21451 [Lineolata rhizophorae]|uniref:Uncharacterized protein n=1 Tax=Lineolata rhizophorae TaxID=578093 RepID=A0A6A6P3G5_9PEZI|nr:hypothetical protein BDY21DRAFT_21451 [Lineolata rhizophorae]